VATVTDVTSGTTLLTVQGPASRELISRLTDADLSNSAFGYLTARQVHVGYAPVLAMRVTYVGELGWELHVPAEYAAGVYDDLMSAGADLGIHPVGLAAMSGLRLEKGYRDMGVDIDNTDNPIEAGLGSPSPGTSRAGSPAGTPCWSRARPARRRTGSWASRWRTRPLTCSATNPCSSATPGSATSAPPPMASPSAARWRSRR